MSEALRAEWSRRSWVESASDPTCGFPLQSLPYCVFPAAEGPHIGVGIGSQILDLHACSLGSLLDGLQPVLLLACRTATLNALIACGTQAHLALRARLMELLDSSADERVRQQIAPLLISTESAALLKPVEPGDYSDFYASIHHATRVGRLFRPDQPLLPNYKFVPIGYHGRASSIVVSGTPVRRPWGQFKPPDVPAPTFAPTRMLDYEVEVAIYIAGGNPLGQLIPIDRDLEERYSMVLSPAETGPHRLLIRHGDALRQLFPLVNPAPRHQRIPPG